MTPVDIDKLKELLSRGVRAENGCLEWPTGGPRDYAHFVWRGQRLRVHRFVVECHLGEKLPSHLFVCHRCDNPKCFEIEHLFVGTNRGNMDDMVRKGRARKSERFKQRQSATMRAGIASGRIKVMRGEDAPGVKLTEQQVREIYHTKGITNEALGRLYGVTSSAVDSIKNGRTWRHLDMGPRPQRPQGV